MRFPPTAPRANARQFCGHSSRAELESATLGIRVRFPVAALVECREDSIGKNRKVERIQIPRRARERWRRSSLHLSTVVQCIECRRDYIAYNEGVVGSNPTGSTLGDRSSVGRALRLGKNSSLRLPSCR